MSSAAAREILDAAELRTREDLARIDLRRLDRSSIPLAERPAQRALRGERVESIEFLLLRSDGETRRVVLSATGVPGAVDGDPGLVLIVFYDVTELRRLETLRKDSFERSEALRTVGEMATGIAHDIGNLLNPISLQASAVSYALQAGDVAQGQKAVESMRAVDSPRRRGAGALARYAAWRAEPKTAPVNLNELAREVMLISKPRMAKSQMTRVVFALEDAPPVAGFASEIVRASQGQRDLATPSTRRRTRVRSRSARAPTTAASGSRSPTTASACRRTSSITRSMPSSRRRACAAPGWASRWSATARPTRRAHHRRLVPRHRHPCPPLVPGAPAVGGRASSIKAFGWAAVGEELSGDGRRPARPGLGSHRRREREERVEVNAVGLGIGFVEATERFEVLHRVRVTDRAERCVEGAERRELAVRLGAPARVDPADRGERSCRHRDARRRRRARPTSHPRSAPGGRGGITEPHLADEGPRGEDDQAGEFPRRRERREREDRLGVGDLMGDVEDVDLGVDPSPPTRRRSERGASLRCERLPARALRGGRLRRGEARRRGLRSARLRGRGPRRPGDRRRRRVPPAAEACRRDRGPRASPQRAGARCRRWPRRARAPTRRGSPPAHRGKRAASSRAFARKIAPVPVASRTCRATNGARANAPRDRGHRSRARDPGLGLVAPRRRRALRRPGADPRWPRSPKRRGSAAR